MLRFTPSLLLLITLLSACGNFDSESEGMMTGPVETVTVTNYPSENLLALREGISNEEKDYLTALEALVERADRELTGEKYTIVNKKVMPPSGSPNDYLSLAPYWWPDPEKEDGLPWIRRDGEVNPITQGDNVDKTQRGDFFDAIDALTYASYLTGEKKYGDRADTLLRTWFLDAATKMNPNLNYAQGIPGRNTGRGYGIIELRRLIGITSDLQILGQTSAISPETKKGVNAWFTEYLDWLQNSKLGLEEASRTNNHGTWYDAQVISILLYLDRKDEARKMAETVKARIDHQIDKEGKQPEELTRTNTLHYSAFNLEAFIQLAYYGKLLGIDLWNHKKPDGGSIHDAFAFLEPYAGGDEEWTLPQLDEIETAMRETHDLFSVAGNYFDIEAYCKIGSAREAQRLPLLLYRCK